MKTAVVYWSGTVMPSAMARAVAEGMTAAGAEAVLLTPAEVAPGDLNAYAAIAFGCPAMGAEVLEEWSSSRCSMPASTASAASAWRCSAPTAEVMASGCAAGRRTVMTWELILFARA